MGSGCMMIVVVVGCVQLLVDAVTKLRTIRGDPRVDKILIDY